MHAAMGNSKFCFIPRGKSAWSLRLFESLFTNCVPVLLSDKWELPFEDFLDTTKFVIKWPAANTTNLLGFLRSIPDAVVDRYMAAAREVRCWYQYPPKRIDVRHGMRKAHNLCQDETVSAYDGILKTLMLKKRGGVSNGVRRDQYKLLEGQYDANEVDEGVVPSRAGAASGGGVDSGRGKKNGESGGSTMGGAGAAGVVVEAGSEQAESRDRGFYSVLDEANRELSGWNKDMKQKPADSVEGKMRQMYGGQLQETAEDRAFLHENPWVAPESKSLRILDGISQQAEGMKAAERVRIAENKIPAEARLWQQRAGRQASFSEKKPNEIEQVLRQIEEVSQQLAARIRNDPPALSRTFMEDLEALIRQNIILKTESEKSAVRMLELQDEVTKLRQDADRNQETFDSMRVTLAKTTNERNELAEECRHGLAMQERDEYARQIVKGEKRLVEYEKTIKDLEDKLKTKDRQLQQGEAERERLKYLGRKQAEKFKDDVTRLVSDKKALRTFLQSMQSGGDFDVGLSGGAGDSGGGVQGGSGAIRSGDDDFDSVMERSVRQSGVTMLRKPFY
eukprot:g170.t1